jgi:RHS repeat-associated protein
LHRDQQTSVLLTTNAAGEASEVRDFDVFGDPVATPSWADTTKEAFTGHQRDVDLGLVNAGARLYDATFGVFASADPLRVSGAGSQGFNPYAYANNDPVNLIDPTGLQAIDDQPVEINPDGSTVFTVYGCRLGTICDGYGGAGAGSSGAVADFLNWAPGGDLSRQELEDIPSGYQAPGLRHPNPFSYWREGEVVDTSETLKAELTIAMGVVNLFELAGAGLAWLSTKAFVKGAEIVATRSVGAGGGWATIGEKAGGAISQRTATSCGAACGEMLSGISQAELIATAGAPTNVATLAKALGAGYRGGYVGPAQLPKLLATGRPFAAELYEGGKLGHLVVVDGTKAGQVLIRDPSGAGSTYSMAMSEFQRVWTGNAVF